MPSGKSRPTDTVYEGLGPTLEDALSAAHDQIPARVGFDFAVSRVVDWGMQRGGFVDERLIWVRVVQDRSADFKT